MIRLADYVASFLTQNGIKDVFLVTGGGAMHLNDALGHCKGLSVTCFHHEQACAMAAEGYTRIAGKPALVNVTTGPGGLNALNGIVGAYQDSIPMLVISGQVRYDTTVQSTGLNLRQLGDQEFDIVGSIKNMTKYAVMVTNPNTIRYHLERALFLSTHGRPGPCWLDIPLNVQAAQIDESNLISYDLSEDPCENPPVLTDKTIEEILQKIQSAKRPVLLAGSGIRTAGVYKSFLQLLEKLQIPVLTAFNAHDCMFDEHPLYVGRPGTIGDRAGNFVFQNSDLLFVLGCRLNIRQIGYSWKTVAREAYKIFVDIDPVEFLKPTIKPDMGVHADVKDVIHKLLNKVDDQQILGYQWWIDWGKQRKERYPVVLPEYWKLQENVNPYCLIESLGKALSNNDIVVTGNGSACVCTFQALRIKENQRLFSNSGCASMGYDLPAAIGACIAAGKSRVVCLTGDGSLQMNIQELQTIIHYKLPIKIFVFNNNGYHSIRQTQTNFFGMPLVGCDSQSGVSFPDMGKISAAYGIPFVRCSSHGELDAMIVETLKIEGPAICEVMISINQTFSPKPASKRLPDGKMVSKPLEDLFPFLPREEFLSNMIISPVPEE